MHPSGCRGLSASSLSDLRAFRKSLVKGSRSPSEEVLPSAANRVSRSAYDEAEHSADIPARSGSRPEEKELT
jgi:hypothetical protein